MQPPQGLQIMLSHRSVFLRDPWVVFNNVSVTMMLLAEREAGFKARCMPGIFCTLSYSFLRLSQSLTYTAIVKQSSELPLATDHSSPSHTNSTTTAVCLSAAAVYRAASPCSPSCLKPHQTSPVVQLWSVFQRCWMHYSVCCLPQCRLLSKKQYQRKGWLCQLLMMDVLNIFWKQLKL